MSYQKKMKYGTSVDCVKNGKERDIHPEKDSYQITRNCQGCGKKATYVNSGNFRVNANGNRLDVWLIYRCAKCRHTYNLTLFERKRPDEIPAEEYERFLANDHELAVAYGRRKDIFVQNKARIVI